MKCFWNIVLGVLLAFPITVQAEELCVEGTLLFREDFGGNDPNDPEVITDANAARAAVPGMSSDYTPCLSRTSGMSSGKFLVTKQGYMNGSGSSQWHLQDDHTHFGDLTRGYLLEIDGQGDNAPFYATTIDGLCPGSRLTFSAYVANVMTWGMYVGRPGVYAYPRLKFVLTNPSDNTELATYDTGDILYDDSFVGDNMCWQQSAQWQLVGMNFTVPTGVWSIRLSIYNNVNSYNGNDFALDDIEIRLCAPPVTIEGEAEVCANEAATLTAQFTNDGTFPEPLGYKWFFSADSISWETLDETSDVLNIPTVHKTDSGWYQIAVAGDGNIESVNCRAMSEPFLLTVKECVDELCVDGTLLFREDFGGNSPDDPDVSNASVSGMDPSYHNSGNSLGSGNYTLRKEGWHNGIQWHWQDDHTYFGDKTRGYLLEVDGIGGTKPFYSKTIDGLCAGSKLTFSAYVVNVHYAGQLDYFGSSYVYPRMKFVLKNPETGAVLAEKSTGDIQPDWRYGTSETWKYARDNQLSAEWQLIGMNFTVPEGVESIQMYIYNDVLQNGNGNDFALDDIEIHLCAPPVTIEGEAEVCANEAATLTAQFTNDGTFPEPLGYKWFFSADSISWETLDETSDVLNIPTVHKTDSGWYQIAVAGDGNIESVNCRAMSEPFLLTVKECEPPVPPCPEMVTITADTLVCDTLMPYRWRDTLFTETARYEILYKDQQGCDSLLAIYTLSVQKCCPTIATLRYDTVVCDTLMPFTWVIDGYTYVFEEPETQAREVMHTKWTDCQEKQYYVRVQTIHCEKLWPLIVNKYNWQLLLDNVAMARFFPGRAIRALQWYKDGQAIIGATGDDYSEQNELHGVFQLQIELDGQQIVWSNILTIGDEQEEPQPVQVRIYNSRGMLMREDQMTRGVYLYHYQQGDYIWTEKRVVL